MIQASGDGWRSEFKYLIPCVSILPLEKACRVIKMMSLSDNSKDFDFIYIV